jgi:RNA polymerase sigma-70 factor (ECF subfamily)
MGRDNQNYADKVKAVAVSNDRGAYASLFAHYAPRVKAYLMRTGSHASLAEEIAQETLLTVWRKAALFDPAKAEASTWIFTIARNLRIDAIRRERRPEIDWDDPALAPPTEIGADDRIAASQNAARVREAMAKLSAEQLEVLKLFYFEDKPHSVIETHLGIPIGTVKSRLRLALARLRSAMKDT